MNRALSLFVFLALFAVGVLACIPAPDGEPPSMASVGLGVALCALAVGGALGRGTVRLGSRCMTLLVLCGLIAYHASALYSAPTRGCGCLPALGHPGHQRILLACSVFLAIYALVVNPIGDVSKSSKQGVGMAGVAAVLVGLIAGWAPTFGESGSRGTPSTEEREYPASPVGPGLRSTEPRPVVKAPSDPPSVHAQAERPWRLRVVVAHSGEGDQVDVVMLGASGEEIDRRRATVADGQAEIISESEAAPRPLGVVAEVPGFIVRHEAILWSGGSAMHEGTALLDFAPDGTKRVTVIAVDGVGRPLSGLRVVATSTLDQRLPSDERQRQRRAAELNLRYAIVESGARGEVVLHDWDSKTVSLEALTPGWERIDQALSPAVLRRMHEARQRGEVADLSDVTPAVQQVDKPLVVQFARVAMTGVRVALGGSTSRGAAVRDWVRIVASDVKAPPCEGWVRQEMTTKPLTRLPDDVLTLGRYLVMDSECAELEGAPAGWAEVESVGYERVRVALRWTFVDAGRLVKATLPSAHRGDHGRVAVRLDNRPQGMMAGTAVHLRIEDEASGVSSVAMVPLGPDGLVAFPVTFPPGNYGLRSSLWEGVAHAEVGSRLANPPTVRCVALAGLRVRVQGADALRRSDYGIVMAPAGQLPVGWSVAADVVVGATPSATARNEDGATYWFKKPPEEVEVRVGGPTLHSKPARATLSSGKTEVVNVSVEVRTK